MKRKNILPYSVISDIIHENTGKRVSKKAAISAEKLLTEYTFKIVKKAKLYAENAGRKTIRGDDITLAYINLKNGS